MNKISLNDSSLSTLIRLYDFTKLYSFVKCTISEDMENLELTNEKKTKYIVLDYNVTIERLIQLTIIHNNVFICYENEAFYIVQKLEKPDKRKIEYLGKERGAFNKMLDVFLIDGEKVVGMRKAIDDLTIDDPKKSERLLRSAMIDRPFVRSKLKLVKFSKYNNTIYPVFTYGDSKKLIKGKKGLEGEFPSLTQAQINKIVNGSRKQIPKTGRHIELIDKYGIEYKKGLLVTTKKVKGRYPNPTRLYNQLKNLGEPLSRETLNKIIKELENEK